MSVNIVSDSNVTEIQNLGQQDFLRLMVAQMQHRVPPHEQEFLSEISQFSSMDALSKMQESMQQMANSLQSNQALQASALVGRKVLLYSEYFKLDLVGDVRIVVDLPEETHSLTVCIYSESGSLIKTMRLETQNSGFFEFTWEGLDEKDQVAPFGSYKVAVTGSSMGKEVPLKTLSRAHVNSVSFAQNGQGLRLNLAGGEAISFDQVKQITIS